ncbi:MAG: hypothetical protein AB7J30_02670 [Hyphomicrobium sp.]|uniref:hypothetical protein n=1 Tax=Hyphomicrobium sp. TaxID=82 RepID=UPI003D0E3C87
MYQDLVKLSGVIGNWFRRWFEAVHPLPILFAAAVAMLLGGVGQLYELYTVLIEAYYDVGQAAEGGTEPTAWGGIQIAIAVVALLTLSGSLYVANRSLGRFRTAHVFQEYHGSAVDSRLSFRVHFVGLLAALLPLLGAAYGVAIAGRRMIRHLETILSGSGHYSQLEGAGAETYFSRGFDGVIITQAHMERLRGLYADLSTWDPVLSLLDDPWFRIGAPLALLVLLLPLAALTMRKPIDGLLLAPIRLRRRLARLRGKPEPELSFKQGSVSAKASDFVRVVELGWLPSLWRIFGRAAVVLATALTVASLVVPLVFAMRAAHAGWLPNLSWTFWADLTSGPEFTGGSATPVGLWAVSATLVLIVAAFLPRLFSGVWSTIARALLWTLAALAVFSGFAEFEWASISRMLGPLAMAIIACLVIFSILVIAAMAARQTGIPILLVLVGIGAVVVPEKLELGNWLLVACLVLSVFLWATWSPQREQARILVVALLAVALVGLHKHWHNVTWLQFTTADAMPDSPAPTASAKPLAEPLPLASTFREWLTVRREAENWPAGKPYPVFIIAAEGGGIYAAAAAATVLSRMQAHCDNFSQHVFAVSGVSGGAVGATIFHSALGADPARTQLAHGPCRPQSLESKEPATFDLEQEVDRVVRDDHLSPLVGLIAPDVLGTANDRAWGLEQSLVKSLCEHFGAEPGQVSEKFDAVKNCEAWGTAPFAAHWRLDKPAPALVLNTTWVRVGNRVVYAPFKLQSDKFVTLDAFGEGGELSSAWPNRYDKVPLVRAAVDSARFPGIVPAQELKTDDGKERWYFVDGGYVDASGAMTAQEIYRSLKEIIEDKPDQFGQVDLRLVLLTSSQTDKIKEGSTEPELRDVMAPIVAVFTVRGLLSRIAAKETIARVAQSPANKAAELAALESPEQKPPPTPDGARSSRDKWAVTVIELNQQDFALELGWKISRLTQDIVSLQIGHPSLCTRANGEAQQKRLAPSDANPKDPSVDRTKRRTPLEVARTIRANSCVMLSMETLLRGE